MRKSPLFALPLYLAVDVVSTWISAPDLGRLDSAHCAADTRKYLLSILSAPQFLIRSATIRSSQSQYINWLISRTVKVAEVIIDGVDGEIDNALLLAFYTAVKSERTTTIVINHYPVNLNVIHTMISRNCKALRAIHLNNCNASSGLEAVLHCCSSTLSSLCLEQCEAQLACEQLPVSLPNLKRLCLKNIPNLETVRTLIAGSRVLKCLYLITCAVDDTCLDELGHRAGMLEDLELITDSLLSDGAVVALAMRCPVLRKLGFAQCYDLTDVCITAFVQHCTELKSVLIVTAFLNPGTSLLAIATHCGPRLTHLAVCSTLCNDDSGVMALSQTCTSLEFLDCNGDVGTVEATKSLVAAQRNLKFLGLNDLSIDDEILSIVARLGSLLKHLSLYEARGYTLSGIIQVAQHCTNLKGLNVDEDSTIVTPGIVAFWRLLRPGLTVSHKEDLTSYWVEDFDAGMDK